jgi:hypothetical protein
MDPARKPWEWVQDLITVDPSGVARWNRSAGEIPYADLVRAAELGLLRGDPFRPYLLLLHPNPIKEGVCEEAPTALAPDEDQRSPRLGGRSRIHGKAELCSQSGGVPELL